MRFIGWLLMASMLGCASGEVEPAQECTTNADCASGICNTEVGLCLVVGPPDMPPSNNPNNVVDMGSDTDPNPPNNEVDMPADMAIDMPVDMPPTTCTPACSANEVCSNGSCVSACMPSCQAPQICTADGCKYPSCSQVGARCEPSQADQGQFLCLVRAGSSEGSCFASCEEHLAASTCSSGSYCFRVSATSSLNYCLESECQSTAECGAETCLKFDNEFGICLSGGNLPEGSACVIDNDQCAQNMSCVRNASTGTAGTCRRLCDPFGASSCGAQQACGPLLTPRTSYCTSSVTSPARTAFQSCAPANSWCGDRTLCAEFETNNFCLAFCRPGANDCDGLLPGENVLCDPYTAGNGLGICWPECDPTDPNSCGDAECIAQGPDAGLCRIPCSAGNEVANCCNGEMPCTAVCNNNYCEF